MFTLKRLQRVRVGNERIIESCRHKLMIDIIEVLVGLRDFFLRSRAAADIDSVRSAMSVGY